MVKLQGRRNKFTAKKSHRRLPKPAADLVHLRLLLYIHMLFSAFSKVQMTVNTLGTR